MGNKRPKHRRDIEEDDTYEVTILRSNEKHNAKFLDVMDKMGLSFDKIVFVYCR